ncbi:MAG: phosphatase PAP2 family protein [Rhodospirillaceae bacterium]
MIGFFGNFIAAHPWRWAMGLAIILCIFPSVDIWFSGLFFDSETQKWVQRSNIMQFLRSGVPPLVIGTVIFYLLLWGAGYFLNFVMWNANSRNVGFLLVSLALGPGLLVESILKTQLGRPRPRDTTVFGGQESFVAALWPMGSCERNCSFVSGHAALAFWATAFAFLFPSPYRLPVILAGLILGLIMGLARIAEGAHFLSDIVFAGIFVVGLNVWLVQRMRLPEKTNDED